MRWKLFAWTPTKHLLFAVPFSGKSPTKHHWSASPTVCIRGDHLWMQRCLRSENLSIQLNRDLVLDPQIYLFWGPTWGSWYINIYILCLWISLEHVLLDWYILIPTEVHFQVFFHRIIGHSQWKTGPGFCTPNNRKGSKFGLVLWNPIKVKFLGLKSLKVEFLQ